MADSLIRIINLWILFPIGLFFRLILIFSVLLIIRRLYVYGKKRSKVAVVVLGDVGRSPRMSYHSVSLASHGFDVTLVGYAGSVPHPLVLESKKIRLQFVKEAHVTRGYLPIFTKLELKIYTSCVSALLYKSHITATYNTTYLLLQNPPCIPSLAICCFLSVCNGSKLIIDWHNYGYSILALSLGENHLMVKVAKCQKVRIVSKRAYLMYEEIFGQLSSGNLCVTKAMQEHLFNKWNISADVMHDRAASIFRKLDNEERHKLFLRFGEDYPEFATPGKGESRFTHMGELGVSMKSDRPAILISSTSWTEDEDFSVLLEALQYYEENTSLDLPNILCVITGKGPQKSYYQKQIAAKNWKRVEIITPWLEASDYPKLLGSADLGVSLHTSSSGLDLPMKVVDMFGSSLPVAAINFNCLSELVQHNVNGFVFENSAELSKQLVNIFSDFPQDRTTLNRLSKEVEKFRNITWNEAWDKNVLPLFKR
uniref:Chitobiosyldiphosphodolichol beta-mannosyltransferase n=1 Tax=Ciona intestinalis TaxID=7719 RepID=F6W713_CIOIN